MFKFLNANRYNDKAIAKAVNSLAQQDLSDRQQEKLIAFLQNPDSRFLYHTNPRFIAAQLELSERDALKLLVRQGRSEDTHFI